MRQNQAARVSALCTWPPVNNIGFLGNLNGLKIYCGIAIGQMVA